MVERFKNNNAVLVALERIISEEMGAINGVFDITLLNTVTGKTMSMIGRIEDLKVVIVPGQLPPHIQIVKAIDIDQLLDLQHETMVVEYSKIVDNVGS